jgi:hypothetical protein
MLGIPGIYKLIFLVFLCFLESTINNSSNVEWNAEQVILVLDYYDCESESSDGENETCHDIDGIMDSANDEKVHHENEVQECEGTHPIPSQVKHL